RCRPPELARRLGKAAGFGNHQKNLELIEAWRARLLHRWNPLAQIRVGPPPCGGHRYPPNMPNNSNVFIEIIRVFFQRPWAQIAGHQLPATRGAPAWPKF